MTNLDSVFKSRDITLPTKVHIVKVMVFLVVMYGCESWTIKKAEHRKIDAFELWCWRRLFESPLDCKEIKPVSPKGNQPWIFIGRTGCWSWSSNTLVAWWEELTHWKRPWFWERLKAGGEGDDRGWGGWIALLAQWTWVWVNSGSWWWTGRPGMLQFMKSQRVGHKWEWLNWTETWSRIHALSTFYFFVYFIVSLGIILVNSENMPVVSLWLCFWKHFYSNCEACDWRSLTDLTLLLLSLYSWFYITI